MTIATVTESRVPAAKAAASVYTVGSYLAARFSQIGLKEHFAVAGDYNLALLDQGDAAAFLGEAQNRVGNIARAADDWPNRPVTVICPFGQPHIRGCSDDLCGIVQLQASRNQVGRCEVLHESCSRSDDRNPTPRPPS